MREEVELLKHHPHVPSQRLQNAAGIGSGGETVAGDRHRARLETVEAIEAPQERALTAAGRTDQSRHAPLLSCHAHGVEHRHAGAVFRQRLDLDHARSPHRFSQGISAQGVVPAGRSSRASNHRETSAKGQLMHR